eukprot:CAMPEP_0176265142 /NCGR_PEP_ID=MMETSP0121_2-20121125/41991_1 /TAXON_ID=160619 /ORGANISM="Kryptoperidinium foliaceum, Strain CCMP 1326" /LENGTH=48 /DNA_ID= /DNA_START= /DNA_END= /DNA_ORIENTATION=
MAEAACLGPTATRGCADVGARSAHAVRVVEGTNREMLAHEGAIRHLCL